VTAISARAPHHFDHAGPAQVSELLKALRKSLPQDGLTVEQLLDRLGERGLLVLCMILVVPFLLPVSIPGSSVPFALTIVFVGAGLAADRPPWLPRRLREKHVARDRLERLLERGAKLFGKIERLTRPRLLALTSDRVMPSVNGALILLAALLLMLPLPLPLSNTIPAYSILFLAAGRLERDGAAIILGYACLILSILYFAAVGLFGTEAVLGAVHALFGT
jgi:hypothetical protein